MDFQNRLAQAVRSAAEDAGGFKKLAEDLRKLCVSGEHPVDRRKLTAIADGVDVSLRLSDIRLLDQYFSARGSRLLATPSLASNLVDKGSVAFILPSWSVHEGRAISLFDVQGMQAVLAAADRQRAGTHVAVQSVPDDWASARPSELERRYEALLSQPASLCALGSPRSSPVSELMLAKMFGVAAFGERATRRSGKTKKLGAPGVAAKLPFHFIWNDRLGKKVMSAFASPAGPSLPPGSCALILDNMQCVCDRANGQRSTVYALIAAQRRPSGHVWIVLAGLTGPGTLSAARALQQGIDVALPELPAQVTPHRVPAKVLWMVVRAELDPAGEVSGVQVVGQPYTFCA